MILLPVLTLLLVRMRLEVSRASVRMVLKAMDLTVLVCNTCYCYCIWHGTPSPVVV